MHLILRPVSILAFGLLLGCLGPTSVDAETGGAERKERILANLKLQFPQLEQLDVTVNDITASEFTGLDQGSFTVMAQGRANEQAFLVSNDDTKLYFIQGEPIDVSKTQDEIQAEIAQREEKAKEEALARVETLERAIAGDPVRGNPDGPVTIVEFSDFQCPFCSRGAQTMEQILEKYGNDVKFVYKHFPLGNHPWARPAAIATICAANQSDDAFWVLHDAFFANQRTLSTDNVMEKSRQWIEGAGIDMAAFTACTEDTDSPEHKAAAAQVTADMQLGQSLGVTGTPGFFVNGNFLNGAQPMEQFEPFIAQAKESAGS
ncbi:MAG: DsbA family protein [Acidobacteriota bacterium]